MQLKLEQIQDQNDMNELYRIEFENIYFVAGAEYEKITYSQTFKINGENNVIQNKVTSQIAAANKSCCTSDKVVKLVKVGELNVPTFNEEYKE